MGKSKCDNPVLTNAKELSSAAPLFPKGLPLRMDPHISFGTNFTLAAFPDATLLFIRH